MFSVPKEKKYLQHMPKKSLASLRQQHLPFHLYNMPLIAKLEHSQLQINHDMNVSMTFPMLMHKTKAKWKKKSLKK